VLTIILSVLKICFDYFLVFCFALTVDIIVMRDVRLEVGAPEICTDNADDDDVNSCLCVQRTTMDCT